MTGMVSARSPAPQAGPALGGHGGSGVTVQTGDDEVDHHPVEQHDRRADHHRMAVQSAFSRTRSRT